MSSSHLEVTEYRTLGRLPDLFAARDGKKITSPEQWEAHRSFLAESAVDLQYGTQPPAPDSLEVQTLFRSEKSASYRITVTRGERCLSFGFHVIFPYKHEGRIPMIVDGDECFAYHYTGNLTDAPRENGIGVALFDRTSLANDVQGEGRRHGALYELYPEYTFGALGAWAWGYSRVVDALLKLDFVDPDWIIFTGHSRGGKTAMLAGVLDKRAAIVNPNDTCAGSCSCYRIEMEAKNENGEIRRSERLSDLMHNFGFWMGEGMYEYADRPQDLPFDCHFLKALVAPRILFISEAVHDIWGNPLGSWQTTMAARKAFDFLGAPNNLYWYFRDGPHFHMPQDMQMLVNLIKHRREGAPLSQDFFRRPFEERELLFD